MYRNPDDWRNIPYEMQIRPQWMVCNDDKVPYAVGDLLYPRDPTNPLNWSPFAPACVYAMQNRMHIGFCLSADDPLTVIDVDYKDELNEHIQNARWFCDNVNTYIESSMSERGIHVVMLGNIGTGLRNNNIEIYSQDRFMIMTGNTIKSLPLMNDPEWLSGLVLHFHPIAHDLPDEADGPAVDDIWLYEQICNSKYRHTFHKLISSDWVNEYGDDPSRADYTFACMMAEFTPSNQQIWNIFRQTPLGQRFKDGKPRHPNSANFMANACRKARAIANNTPKQEIGGLHNAINAFKNGIQNANGVNVANGNVYQFPQRLPTLKRYHFDTLSAYEVMIEEPADWMLENVFHECAVNAIYGNGGAGKTFIALDLMFCVSQGIDWFGHETKQMDCLYIALEGRRNLNRRLKAYWIGRNLAAMPSNVEISAREDFKLNLRNSEMVDAFIADRLEKGKTSGLILVDTMIRATPGMKENDNTEMQQAVDGAERIRDALHATIVIIHHTAKGSKEMRGATALYDACEGTMGVFKEYWPKDSKQKDAPDVFKGYVVKMPKVRESKSIDEGYWFALDQQDIWMRQRKSGEWVQETSCTIRPIEEPIQGWDDSEPPPMRAHRGLGTPGPRESKARSNSEYQKMRLGANEKMLLDGWSGWLKKYGIEWEEKQVLPLYRVEELMKAKIAGKTDGIKQQSIDRALAKLQDKGFISADVDSNGNQVIWKLT